MTEDEMVGWHHRLNGHEFEQTPGDSEGQGSLACCSPWGCNESDMTQGLNSKKVYCFSFLLFQLPIAALTSYCKLSGQNNTDFLFFSPINHKT